jgi:hypothetical protein
MDPKKPLLKGRANNAVVKHFRAPKQQKQQQHCKNQEKTINFNQLKA